MIIKIIGASVLLLLIIKFPGISLTVGILALVAYKLTRRDKPSENDKEKEYKPYIPYEGEVEKSLKPGYKEDPEWQRLSKSIKDHMTESKKSADQEMIEDLEAEIHRLKMELSQSRRS